MNDINPENQKPSNHYIERTLAALNKEYVLVGKTRVKSWHAWLVIGILAGAVAGITLVANRSGEFGKTLAATPTGWLDLIDVNGNAGGWAVDPDASSVSIDVHFYVDGAAGQGGVFAGATNANIPRPDVNSATGYPGNHGFNFSIPSQFRDGLTHQLYAHGIDTSGVGTQNVLLSGVPKSFTLGSPTSPPPSSSTSGELWMAPTHVGRNGQVYNGIRPELKELFYNENSWSEARSRVRVFKLYAGNLMVEDTFLRDYVIPKLKQWGIKMALETGGGTGTHCDAGREQLFNDELAFVQKIKNYGGWVDYLIMDSAISISFANCPYDFPKLMDNVVRYVRTYKQQFPGVQIGLTDPLPHRFKGTLQPDAKTAMSMLMDKLRQNGLTLELFEADIPYEYAESINRSGYGSWTQIKDVENFIKGLGLQFGLIYNSEEGGGTSNQLFYTRTLDMFRKYNGVSGQPQQFIVQSWYIYPDIDIPDNSTTNYPFTRVVKDFSNLSGVGIGGSTSPPPSSTTGIIQGFKVPTSDATIAGQTVNLDGKNSLTSNPYTYSGVSSGSHTTSVTIPSGYNVGYTLCYNSTTCHNNTPTSGSSVTVNVPSGGYADLWWHYSPTTTSPPPSSTSCNQIGSNNFYGCYFDNKDFTNLLLTRTDAAINFNWGSGSPASNIGVDTFSVRWEGDWNFSTTNTYRFSATVDDGIRVWLDNVLILDKWFDQGATTYTVDRSVNAGTHRIKVEYYENGGGASAQFSWAYLSGTTSPQPSSDITVPVVSITSPKADTKVSPSSYVTILADASDNVGVTRVEFTVNDLLKCTDTTVPYSCTWLVPGGSGAKYQLRARAYDAAGNVGYSLRIRVTTP